MRQAVKNVEPALLQPKSVRVVALSPDLAERLLKQNSEFVETLVKALLPLRFKATATFNGISIDGDSVAVLLVVRILERIAKAVPASGILAPVQVQKTITSTIDYALKHDLVFRLPGLIHLIRPMSLSQVIYMNSLISPHEQLVVVVGPTGSGKTHLAIAAGISLLAENAVKHIVITRPHVRLDGEVVTPSIRAEKEYDDQFTFIEDIFHEFMSHAQFEQMIAQRQLEITPIGRLRGRTFNNSFIIVDGAQNTTISTMRMAVTHIGQGTRMVITGNPAHIDLYEKEESGLSHFLKIIEGTDIATIHRLENKDIVRSDLVRRLEELYSQHGESNDARVCDAVVDSPPNGIRSLSIAALPPETAAPC